jgi:hypothetical protein
MRFIILILIASLIGACDDEPKPPPEKLKDLTGQYEEICLDGIVYYSTPWALTPKYSRETTYPDRCP